MNALTKSQTELASFEPGGVFTVKEPDPNFQINIINLAAIFQRGYSDEFIEMTPLNGIVTHHHFLEDGVYIREVLLPKNIAVIGQVHLTEHFVIINGDCEISCADSHQRYIGYNRFTSDPGMQRAVFTFEDTVFTTIHHVKKSEMTKFKALADHNDGSDALKHLISVETYADFCALSHRSAQ